MNVELISAVAFFTTTEADDPARSVLADLLLPPFEAWLCLEISFDVFLTVFEDPLTNLDVEQAAEAVSNLGLFSAGSSVASQPAEDPPSSSSWPQVGGEEEEEEEEHAAPSAESGGDSVFLFLCVCKHKRAIMMELWSNKNYLGCHNIIFCRYCSSYKLWPVDLPLPVWPAWLVVSSPP